MPTTPTPLEVVYCEGWDPATTAPIGLLDTATARARDEAGEQYAVLVRTPDAAPLVLLEISWDDRYCGIWLFDAEGRCHTHHRYTRADGGGELLLSHGFQWNHPPRGAMPDRRDDWTVRVGTLNRGRGLYRYQTQHGGGLTSVNRAPDPELARVVTLPAPTFGDWAALLRAHPVLAEGELRLSGATVEPGGAPVAAPWTPPRPLAPRRVDDLFRPGSRFTSSWYPGTGTVGVRDIGTVNLPTGRVVVHDPSSLAFAKDPEAFTVPLPPGEHPMRLSLLHLGEDGDEEPSCVMALRVDVRNLEALPVASWEMALRPGQDPHDLEEDHFYGVGVDGGQIGVTDATCLPYFADLFDGFHVYERVFHGLPEEQLQAISDRERLWQDTARALIARPEFHPDVRDALPGRSCPDRGAPRPVRSPATSPRPTRPTRFRPAQTASRERYPNCASRDRARVSSSSVNSGENSGRSTSASTVRSRRSRSNSLTKSSETAGAWRSLRAVPSGPSSESIPRK
jgi:hypothetical protein